MTSIDPAVTALVLGSALLHAIWNAMVKTGGRRLVTMTSISLTWGLLGMVGAVLVPFPHIESWPYLLASVVLHWFYQAGLLAMYRVGDLGLVYPLARGTAPILLAGLSIPLAGEVLAPQAWAGVGAVSLGIIILTVGGRFGLGGKTSTKDSQGKTHRSAIIFALLTGLTIVSYTLVDGLGVRLAGSSLGYAAWMFLIAGSGWFGVWVWLVLRGQRPTLREVIPAMGAGGLSFTAYAMVLWALNLAPVAMVSALRETGVIFAAVIGALFLGEPFARHRIGAAVLVAFGVALLNWPQG